MRSSLPWMFSGSKNDTVSPSALPSFSSASRVSPCSSHGSSGAQGDSTPTCGLTDTKRVWAAFRNPEGCQMVAGGRSGAATPGQLGGVSRGTPEGCQKTGLPLSGTPPGCRPSTPSFRGSRLASTPGYPLSSLRDERPDRSELGISRRGRAHAIADPCKEQALPASAESLR